MGDNEIICNAPDSLENPLFLFVPKRLPPNSLQSPSLGSIVNSDFYQKSSNTMSPKDDWSAIVQPSISNKRLPGCRTGSYNSFESFNARLNDLNSEYPTMRQLHSNVVSMWSLDESVGRHISTDWVASKNQMHESVIYPPFYQKNNRILFCNSQRKFSCPALFQLQNLSIDPKLFHQGRLEKIKTTEPDGRKQLIPGNNACLECLETGAKVSPISPLVQAHQKNYLSKCESWLKEIKINHFQEN